MKPLCVDLYCGLGGWAEGFLAEGWDVVGFDIERHDYGTGGYPGWLVLQDVTTLHGSQFKDASCIVASPPCQGYSYRAMPWKRAKALPPPDNTLFFTCWRIQQEAIEAAGRFIPLIVENVRGAQKWVGRSAWHFGSFHLWGDLPALMPVTGIRKVPGLAQMQRGDKSGLSAVGFNVRAAQQFREGIKLAGNNGPRRWEDREVKRLCDATKNTGGSWFNVAHNKSSGLGNNPVSIPGVKQAGISGPRDNDKGDRWFQDGAAQHGSKSNSRKAASAQIAKIPFPLSSHIARVYKPDTEDRRQEQIPIRDLF